MNILRNIILRIVAHFSEKVEVKDDNRRDMVITDEYDCYRMINLINKQPDLNHLQDLELFLAGTVSTCNPFYNILKHAIKEKKATFKPTCHSNICYCKEFQETDISLCPNYK